MKKLLLKLGVVGGSAIAAIAPMGTASAGQTKPQTRVPGEVARVVAAHDAAINACNARAAAAVYSKNAKLFTAGGAVVSGRPALLAVYTAFLKPRADGGLCGLREKHVETFRSGNTIFVQSEVTAPFLAAPYFSTDGFIIKRDHIVSEMSTFNATQLKFK